MEAVKVFNTFRVGECRQEGFVVPYSFLRGVRTQLLAHCNSCSALRTQLREHVVAVEDLRMETT